MTLRHPASTAKVCARSPPPAFPCLLPSPSSTARPPACASSEAAGSRQTPCTGSCQP